MLSALTPRATDNGIRQDETIKIIGKKNTKSESRELLSRRLR